MILYRYDDSYYSNNYAPFLRKFRVIKETPKGYWIKEGETDGDFAFGEYEIQKEKWVSKHTKFVFKNKKDAMYSYYRRKLAHRKFLTLKHRKVNAILNYLDREEGLPSEGEFLIPEEMELRLL